MPVIYNLLELPPDKLMLYCGITELHMLHSVTYCGIEWRLILIIHGVFTQVLDPPLSAWPSDNDLKF